MFSSVGGASHRPAAAAPQLHRRVTVMSQPPRGSWAPGSWMCNLSARARPAVMWIWQDRLPWWYGPGVRCPAADPRLWSVAVGLPMRRRWRPPSCGTSSPCSAGRWPGLAYQDQRSNPAGSGAGRAGVLAIPASLSLLLAGDLYAGVTGPVEPRVNRADGDPGLVRERFRGGLTAAMSPRRPGPDVRIAELVEPLGGVPTVWWGGERGDCFDAGVERGTGPVRGPGEDPSLGGHGHERSRLVGRS
jgi:hypothetical protein